MNDPIVCEGSPRLKDAFDVLLLHVKPRPLLAILGSALLVLALAVCFLPRRTPEGNIESPSLLLPAILALLAVYAFVYVPWNLRRLYLQNPLRDMSSRLEATHSGLTLTSQRGEARLQWSDFRRWRSNHKVLLLYVTDAWFVAFPARLLASPEAYTALRNMVEKQLGKAS